MKYFLWPFSSLPESKRVVVSYKRKYVHGVLVNGLVSLAQEKVWLDELTKAVDWDVKQQTNSKICEAIDTCIKNILRAEKSVSFCCIYKYYFFFLNFLAR